VDVAQSALWPHARRHGFAPPFTLAVGFVAARGGLGHYPLNIGDALISPNPALNAVSLNPVYSVLRTVFRASERQYAFYGEAQNLGTVRRLLGLEETEPEDPTYPFSRTSPGTPRGNRKNVILFVLESWSAKDVTCLRGRPGVSPVFDDDLSVLPVGKAWTDGSRGNGS